MEMNKERQMGLGYTLGEGGTQRKEKKGRTEDDWCVRALRRMKCM